MIGPYIINYTVNNSVYLIHNTWKFKTTTYNHQRIKNDKVIYTKKQEDNNYILIINIMVIIDAHSDYALHVYREHLKGNKNVLKEEHLLFLGKNM